MADVKAGRDVRRQLSETVDAGGFANTGEKHSIQEIEREQMAKPKAKAKIVLDE